ncbi:hypothetical protein HZ994_06795 [Akkermansiaceae bacterium]|nr:hypothetical protein HZ994_06795 [Akkermansiaceae bacterium]
MNTNFPETDAKSSLEKLSWTGCSWLWKCRLRDGFRARIPRAATLLIVIPVLAIVIIMFGWILGKPWKPSMGLMAFLCPLPPLLYLGYHAIRLCRKRPERREGLAVFDEALDLKDRLQTADEFLAAPKRTPFMEAAIADAGSAMEEASRTSLEWNWGKPLSELKRLAAMFGLALVLLLIGGFLPTILRSGSEPQPPGGGIADATAHLPAPLENTPTDPEQSPIKTSEPKPENPEKLARKATKGAPALTQISEEPSGQLDGRDKISVGTSEGGQTSQAASSGRASQSSGMPGSQAPSSEPEEQQLAKKKEPKPQKDKESDADDKKAEDESGATAGRGSSGGSSRNPASSDWASKDRTETADNEEFDQQEEVDDEDSESEARGGLQPNLRDRRPPVNRDLGIGFGNQASPDANGRSGPGERKKSRGVAGLVLGVPIPDHVKGQSNPGRVKVNQERVQPQGEQMPGDTAKDRGRRSSPAGHLSERTLDTPMRQIVRDYFLKNRASETSPSNNEPSITEP